MRTNRLLAPVLLAGLCALALAGCNDDKAPAAAAPSQQPDEVTSAAPSTSATLGLSPSPTLAPRPTATTAAGRSASPRATASRTTSPSPRRTSSPTPRPTPKPTPVRTTTSPKPVVTSQPPATGTKALTISDFAFSPKTFTIARGTTVRVTNKDSTTHTWTSSSGVWDSGALGQGASYSYRFMAKGTFDFLCEPHPFMTGRVTVT